MVFCDGSPSTRPQAANSNVYGNKTDKYKPVNARVRAGGEQCWEIGNGGGGGGRRKASAEKASFQ